MQLRKIRNDDKMNKVLLKMAGMVRDTDNSDELELFYRLSKQKAPDGSKLFNSTDIGNIDIGFDDELLDYKEIIVNVLNNVSKLEEISKQKIGERGPEFVALCTEEMKKAKEKQDTVKTVPPIESEGKDGILSGLIREADMLSALSMLSEKKVDSRQDISCLQMGISRVLAKASIEILGERTTERVLNYFKEVEEKFKTHAFDRYDWTKYAVTEYDKLKQAGIIDENGRVLDFTKLLESSLVTQTPSTFHYTAGSPVQLKQAPSLQASENGNGTQKDMHER